MHHINNMIVLSFLIVLVEFSFGLGFLKLDLTSNDSLSPFTFTGNYGSYLTLKHLMVHTT